MRHLRPIPIVLLALALVLGSLGTPMVAEAHHNTIYANASCENGYNFGANYVGGGSWRRVVVDVDANADGTPESIDFTWEGVHPGFNLFDRSGTAEQNVDVTGTVKMYSRTWHTDVSEDFDTDTFDGDHNSNSSMNATINFFDSDRQVSVTADAGYSIIFIGIDYTGNDANEVTFGPEFTSPYDAPGNETIDNITVTVHRPESGHYTYSLIETDTFNFHQQLDCYEACEITHEVAGAWSEWVFNEQTGKFERSRTIEIVGERGEDCGERTETEERDPESETRYFSEVDCTGWQVFSQAINEGDAPDGDPVLVDSGSWSNPFVLETATSQFIDGTMYEPENCEEPTPDSYTDCDGVFIFNEEAQAFELVYTWKDPYKTETWGDFVEPSACKQCLVEQLGWLFHLVGAEGQTCDLASYQINPNTGDFAIPNTAAQQKCCGFVAVNIPFGREIVIGCDGEVNIVCARCTGGGPPEAYGED